MSQNEEENVLTSTNSTNSTVSESLSHEFPSWPPAMTVHDLLELSSDRPMSTDNGPQLSSVTWLMSMDHGQRLSPSTVTQLPLGQDPQLQSSSTLPMTYEPNQQPMTASQYHAVQINYHAEMQPMSPPSHDAVQINNYRRSQMQPMSPPSHDAVQINNYRRSQMQPMSPPSHDAVQINNYRRSQMQPMPPSHDAVQVNNYRSSQMQPMPPSHDAVQVNNYRSSQMQPMPPMTGNGGVPSIPTPWIGSILPHNPSFFHCECCSFSPNAYYHGAPLQLALQQRRGVEQNMQLADPRSQGSQSVLQLQQRRGVEQNMQLADPRSQGLQSVLQLQSPADRSFTLGRQQRPWTSFFQRPGNADVGRTMALECRQLNGTTIRYCSTCNALLPANGKPPATHGENNSCKVTALLPDNCIPLFECYLCYVRIRMENIAGHVATAHPDNAVPDKDGEPYMSYFCGDCHRVMYAPWRVFAKHRQSLHYTPGEHSVGGAGPGHDMQPTQDVMYALMRDFVLNGREVLLYACLSCKFMGPYSRNRRTRCEVCARPGNKFYCQHCNVVFFALQVCYDMHRFTFEHFYFMHHRRARSNAAVRSVDAGNTGGGRGGGRRRGRAPARDVRGRGRAAGNGVASASEQ